MSNIFITNIGDLSDIQRVSYYKFLIEGLNSILEPLAKKELYLIRRIRLRTGEICFQPLYYNLYFAPKNIKLSFPEEEFVEIDEENKTYSIQSYLPIFYSLTEEQDKRDKCEKNYKKAKNTNNNIIYNIINSKINKFNKYKKKITPYSKHIREKSVNHKLKTIYCSGDIYLSEIPLITQHGTFLITGCERIVVSQLIRAPGIYFRKELNPITGENLCTATIISDKGIWTKFLLTSLKNTLNFYVNASELIGKTIFDKREEEERLKKREWELDLNEDEEIEQQEISIFSFLEYFGISYEEIFSHMSDTQKDLLEKFSKKTQFEETIPADELEEILESRFFHDKIGYLSIGNIGRKTINYKFSQNFPESITMLTGSDFIFMIKNIINLKFFGMAEDDIDHLKNKQIRPVGDILQNQFEIGYLTSLADLEFFEAEENDTLEYKSEYKKSPEYKENPKTLKLKNFENILYSNTKEIFNTFLEFFKSSEISQYMDETNPLAEIAHKRRITIFGPNGLERDNISDDIRDIHTSQYAKLCPIETPEGETAGLVSSLALFARFNSMGFLETPFLKISSEKIEENQPAIYLDAGLESFTNIGFCDTYVDKKSLKIIQENISIKEDIFLSSSKKEEVSYLSLSPNQLLSLSTNLVPFIEHDDANRGLMGANMQRQAVPLIYNQKAIVGTGLEANSIQGSSMTVTSYTEGKIYKVTNQYLIIEDLTQQKLFYELKTYYRSNQDTCMHQQACVWPGEHVFSNQIIADAGGTLDGELALGKNLLIAYMPWDGYNFEDAIVINEKLVINNSLTSIQIEEYETDLEPAFFDSSDVLPYQKEYAISEFFENWDDISAELIFQIVRYFLDKALLKNPNLLLTTLSEDFITLDTAYRDLIFGKELTIKDFEAQTIKEMYDFLKVLANWDEKIKKEILNAKVFSFLEKFLKKKKLSLDLSEADIEALQLVIERETFSKDKQKKKKKKRKTRKRLLTEDDLDSNLTEEDLMEDIKLSIQEFNELMGEEKKRPSEIFLTHFHLGDFEARNLDFESIIKKGSYVYPNDILVGKIIVTDDDTYEEKNYLKKYNLDDEAPEFKDFSFRAPKYLEGRVLEIIKFIEKVEDEEESYINEDEEKIIVTKEVEKLKLFIGHIRKIEMGDKLAGRHGNKGIISKIVAQQDMPFLEDGTSVDIIFNPLGVPSRMNVGQVFETLLGFAGFYIGKRFKVAPFDELFGEQASRILITQKLKEARSLSKNNSIFSAVYPGKSLLRDGRTGEFFDNPILVGRSYIVKLAHLVHNKEHARSIGPYSLITEQPFSGKAKEGGQRFGEMESWALEGFGSAFILYELFNIKSDNIDERNEFYQSIISGNFEEKPFASIGETFITLTRELNGLGLNFIPKEVNLRIKKMPELSFHYNSFFKNIEEKLSLTALINKERARKRSKERIKEELTKKKKSQKILKQYYKKNFLKNFLNLN
jgi:DNA-directed RNA polymerase beta subunit